MIWVTSDLHFGHDQPFVWQLRGYNSVEDMNLQQVQKFNSVVSDDDEVWILGDLVVGNIEGGLQFLKLLKGKIHVCLGNHDSDKRAQAYKDLGWDVQLCARFKYKKIQFYLSHFPTVTTNFEDQAIWQATINIYGHTHQATNFYKDEYWMYHAGVDSHDGYPVSLDQVLQELRERTKKILTKGEKYDY